MSGLTLRVEISRVAAEKTETTHTSARSHDDHHAQKADDDGRPAPPADGLFQEQGSAEGDGQGQGLQDR